MLGDLAHDREIMADEQIRHTRSLADVGEQIEDLSLDRYVERRHGFVEDDQARLRRKRPRDRNALALSARKRTR